MSHITENKRLVKNTLALYFRTAIVMLVSLYVSRVLLKELGVSDYGIYNVVGSVIVLFSFLNTSMSQAIQRFLTFELGNNDMEQLKRMFSMSIITQFLIVVVLFVLCETLGVWLLNNYLNIPSDRIEAANWTFQMSILTLGLNIMTIPYTASVTAYEKMSFFAYASIVDAVLKLTIAFSLPLSGGDKLEVYALLLVLEAFVMLFVYRFYCRNKFSTCKFNYFWDKDLFRRLMSFSGWTLCGSLTNILTQKGFVLLLNVFYGVVANTAMGLANQVSSAVVSFIGSFHTSFRPQIVKAYARNDGKYLSQLISATSKISFVLVFIPAFILMINAPLVLKLWLGEVPQYTVEFCRMILICTIIDATTGPYNYAITATGTIRNYQISISVSFFLDLVVSAVLMKLGITPYLILISRILTRGILNMIIGLFFIHNLLSFNVLQYVKTVLVPIGKFVLLMLSTLCMGKFTEGWSLFLLSSVYIVLLGGTLFFYIMMNKLERSYILDVVRKYKKQ